MMTTPTPANQPRSMLQTTRRRLAVVAMLVLAVWPAWSISQIYNYLLHMQPEPQAAARQWEQMARRFAGVRLAFEPGTVFFYHGTQRIHVAPGRLHDVQFVTAPLIVTEKTDPPTDLVLADMVNDDELKDFIAAGNYTLLRQFGPGLAVLQKPAGGITQPGAQP